MTDPATIGRTMLDVSKRVGAWVTIALAFIAAVVALQAGRPLEALDHVEAAIPAVEAVLEDADDTDAHTDTEAP